MFLCVDGIAAVDGLEKVLLQLILQVYIGWLLYKQL